MKHSFEKFIMASETPAYPVKGDLFVCDNEDSMTVVSMKGATVNLTELRRTNMNRGNMRLRLRLDPNTNQLFVAHCGKCYLLMRQDDPNYETRKPVDEVREVVEEFDARDFLKVGDEIRYISPCDASHIFTARVTKVTKCFVTYKATGYPVTQRKKAYFYENNRDTIHIGRWERELTEPTKELDYVVLSLTHLDHDNFIKYFIEQNKDVYENYIRLVADNKMLYFFEANPLAFIITNQPACCYNIAVAYIKANDFIEGGPF